MAKQLTMPKLGLTMKSGRIVKWYKSENDPVNKGDKLYSVETDKLTNDIESTESGVLLKIIADVGDTVPCLEPVCIIGEVNEDISQLLTIEENEKIEVKDEKIETKTLEVKDAKKDDGGRIKISPAAKKLAIENDVDFSKVMGSGPNGRIILEDIEKIIENRNKIKITPTAQKMAEKYSIDPSEINKDDRIRKEDILKFRMEKNLIESASPVEERAPMTGMRKIIAERMSDSWNISPAVTFDIRVDITKLKEIRQQLKKTVNITYTDLIVKIVSKVLLDFPLLNSTVDGEEIILRNYVNMGVAVALEEGLLVPVVKYSNIKGLEQISAEIKELSYKAKNNQLTTDEITGGTFTISNIGMFGVESFSPIINQPEVGILGINAIVETPVVENGNIVIRPLMNLSLTADHRVVDGAVAAQFLSKLKEYIENPALLLL
ncbi:2-oxo acid dehydrogenase subunit E2 [Tissierella carlieri]|uniref:dihydrolipoamide acetyltransferase family protein n=1 Tax=Tissierella carlieri TaxID=689904 RepID=UPI001C113ABE|nr:dihydrolipoamide acetyltransferase family protein [Tissierella carlieri]MBU5312834.1 2-oxo acid dehydrogenase subunit E2 [Tissierella carlieri]